MAPRPLGEFVGWKEELQCLKCTLKPGKKVVIFGVIGMGGVGKTELAKVVAHHVVGQFKDDMPWADCCPQQSLETVADQWAAAYGVLLANGGYEDLFTWLEDKYGITVD